MPPAKASDALREAVRYTRMYSCDALLAADSVLQELSHLNAVLDILRRVNPDLVSAAEIEALSTP